MTHSNQMNRILRDYSICYGRSVTTTTLNTTIQYYSVLLFNGLSLKSICKRFFRERTIESDFRLWWFRIFGGFSWSPVLRRKAIHWKAFKNHLFESTSFYAFPSTSRRANGCWQKYSRLRRWLTNSHRLNSSLESVSKFGSGCKWNLKIWKWICL